MDSPVIKQPDGLYSSYRYQKAQGDAQNLFSIQPVSRFPRSITNDLCAKVLSEKL
jgi:hypothetical protein